jgi:hypothetical protein
LLARIAGTLAGQAIKSIERRAIVICASAISVAAKITDDIKVFCERTSQRFTCDYSAIWAYVSMAGE